MIAPSLRLEGPRSSARASAAVLGVSLAVAVALGAAVAGGRQELALLAAAATVGAVALRELPLAGWCGLLLFTTVATRGIVSAAGLPELVSFLHYPVAAAMAIAALRRPYRPASRAPAIWLGGLVVLTSISLVANLSHPLRALVFLLIVGEPLVVVWALTRWGISPRERRTIGSIVFVLALVQVPIAVVQAGRYGFGDHVQATLTGHGAGHHVLGALFALALLVVVTAIAQRRLAIVPGVVAGGTCLFMMVASGSMAITILTGLVVPLCPILAAQARSRAGDGTGRRAPRPGLTLLASAVLGMTALVVAQLLVPGIYERARRVATPEQSYELELLAERVGDPAAMAFGSGPGTTASRAGILLVGADATGSPLAFLGLEPTPEALEIAASTRNEYGGSAEAARSSGLGIVGDLGLLGLLGVGVVFALMWREAGRSDDWLAPAARAALVLAAMLAFVDSWLEYPEFAVPLAVLVGIVLSRRVPSGVRGS